MNDKGDVAWDIDNWSFLLNGKDYDSIRPSLQRQATLNKDYDLHEVVFKSFWSPVEAPPDS